MTIKTRLPKGYVEFGRDEYEALDVETLRAVYAALRETALYSMTREQFDCAVKAQNPVTPVDWIMAIKALRIGCERCRESGVYQWGACVNGRMPHSAPCARCNGTGRMTFDDMRRYRCWINHAICAAVG
jgi:hypothetical protein